MQITTMQLLDSGSGQTPVSNKVLSNVPPYNLFGRFGWIQEVAIAHLIIIIYNLFYKESEKRETFLPHP